MASSSMAWRGSALLLFVRLLAMKAGGYQSCQVLGSTGAELEDHGMLSVDALPIRSKCILLSQLQCLGVAEHQPDPQDSLESLRLDDVLSLENRCQMNVFAVQQKGCEYGL
jgi:hypothetical protein